MHLFWKLLVWNLGTICLVNGRSTVSDEYFDTVPGATVTIKCPEPTDTPVYLHAVDEGPTIPELNDNNMISYTGFIVLSDVTEADSRMYVCTYPEKKIPPLKIHLKVAQKELHEDPERIDKPRFSLLHSAAAANRQRKQKPRRRQKPSTSTTTSTEKPETTVPPSDLEVNPDSPPGAEPDELNDYQKRSELRKSLVPPSKPEVQKVNATTVQVKWTINLMKKYPIAYFMIQYLDKQGDDVLGGANEVHDVAKVPSILYWHNFDNLLPGHSYQFRVAAVYKVPDEISVLSKKSDWAEIK